MLTERETEILRLTADGLGCKEIATKLYLSSHTIEWHIKNLKSKLNATTIAHAVSIAYEHRILYINRGQRTEDRGHKNANLIRIRKKTKKLEIL